MGEVFNRGITFSGQHRQFVLMRKSQKPSSLRNEILSVVLFSVSLVMFLSLISYYDKDHSLFYYTNHPQKIHNLLGIIGSNLSALLFQGFGFSAFLLVVAVFHLSVRLFITLKFSFRPLKVLSFLGLMFSTSGLINLNLGKVTFFNFSGNAGGLLGLIVSDFLIKYLNKPGANILLILVLVLSLRLYTNLSFIRLGRFIFIGLTFLGKGLFFLFQTGKEIFTQKKTDRAETKPLKEKEPLPLFREREEPQIIQKEPVIIAPPAPDKIPPEKPNPSPQPILPSGFKLPPLTLLHDPQREVTQIEREFLLQNSRLLENKLNDFGVQATVVNVHPGPVVTLYELEPAPGVKINRIVNLADDLALGLKAMGIRIIAPIPGRGAIGVEIPNKNRETVFFKEIVGQEKFLQNESPLTLGMGKDIYGMPIIADLAKMPHLLIAGTTGSGKSVFINSMICSILYKALPTDVKLLFIDPKRSELTLYEDIPHLIYPVVTDAKQAAEALRWAVEEMERRYHSLARMGARDIWVYNQKVLKSQASMLLADSAENGEEVPPQKMPWIVIVIDELANLMTVATREVEWLLARLAQMARAAGIHLLVATQRPSVDIVTGTIKANFPARISFRLSTKTDSRIILDCNGAENLLNQGDMLFLSPRSGRIKRLQGPFLSDDEILRIVEFLKEQAKPEYQELHLEVAEETSDDSAEVTDEKYREAVVLVTNLGQASISLIQRKLRIGYNRAARMIEKMEEDGIVGPSDGVKPREVLRKMVDI